MKVLLEGVVHRLPLLRQHGLRRRPLRPFLGDHQVTRVGRFVCLVVAVDRGRRDQPGKACYLLRRELATALLGRQRRHPPSSLPNVREHWICHVEVAPDFGGGAVFMPHLGPRPLFGGVGALEAFAAAQGAAGRKVLLVLATHLEYR